jgi:hypothetical protein
MSLSRAEIPGSGQAERASQRGTEAMPRITRLNRGLYALVFYVLGVALLNFNLRAVRAGLPRRIVRRSNKNRRMPGRA